MIPDHGTCLFWMRISPKATGTRWIFFTRFLLCTPFPQKKVRIRPDNAKGFLNLKRAINALNLSHSTPDGFYMESDFSRIHAPKEKAHLESSHRSFHNFEIRIIKAFENRIVKTEPGFLFSNGRKRENNGHFH